MEVPPEVPPEAETRKCECNSYRFLNTGISTFFHGWGNAKSLSIIIASSDPVLTIQYAKSKSEKN
jgi:hypothetical protein